ncbi:MAG: TOBE domain-containing protein [Campylobacter sp.]|nr:TOBE domain-containing protein [Campylobacter sp.]
MIKAKISSIKEISGVLQAKFDATNLHFKMVALAMDKSLKVGQTAIIGFKSSDVIVSPCRLNCSLSNEIPCIIKEIKIDEILCVLSLTAQNLGGENFEFESIITADSTKRLNLNTGDSIFAYIKATSLYIKQLL